MGLWAWGHLENWVATARHRKFWLAMPNSNERLNQSRTKILGLWPCGAMGVDSENDPPSTKSGPLMVANWLGPLLGLHNVGPSMGVI